MDKQREAAVLAAAGELADKQNEEIYQEALAGNNPLAHQVRSGVRGNKAQLAALLGSDLLYSDQHNRPVPVPVTHSYPQGLDPAEYWAATYGARRGVIAVKLATRDAGYLSKVLAQASHRLIVTGLDDDRPRR
jgi:DNA-directed RNA polymerase subunit beta'